MKGENRAENPVHSLPRARLAGPSGPMHTGGHQKIANPVLKNTLGVRINACALASPTGS